MKKYGYIINSAEADVLMKNLHVLLDYGCDDLYMENDVLENEEKVELTKLFSKLKSGDEVIIPDLGMFGERQEDVQHFTEELVKIDVHLRILSKKTDIRYHQLLPPQLELLEQQRKRDYAPGTMGRPKINQKKVDEIIHYRIKERLTFREISERTDLSLGTVYNYIKKYEKAKR